MFDDYIIGKCCPRCGNTIFFRKEGKKIICDLCLGQQVEVEAVKFIGDKDGDT